MLVLLTCRERTRERERRIRREMRERTGKDMREKVELITREMEINQIILYTKSSVKTV